MHDVIKVEQVYTSCCKKLHMYTTGCVRFLYSQTSPVHEWFGTQMQLIEPDVKWQANALAAILFF